MPNMQWIAPIILFSMLFIHTVDTQPVLPIRSRFTFTKMENTVGFIGKVKVTGTPTFSLRKTSETFTINATSGVIDVLQPLDRETVSSYAFVVIATSVSGQKSGVMVTVVVDDENDNTPSFDDVVRKVEVVERRNYITTVSATDTDIDANGQVYYSLENTHVNGTRFYINEITGRLIAWNDLDYEQITSAEIIIIATDNGQGQRSSSMTVLLTVLDKNDVWPYFPQRKYKAKIGRDDVGLVVANIVATDGDASPEYSTLSYAIWERNTPFRISSTNGSVWLQRQVTDETIEEYRFSILASDGEYRASASVVVIFTSESIPIQFLSSIYQWEIYEELPVGYKVATIRTKITRPEMTMYIRTETPFEYFDIIDGVLTVKSRIDRENLTENPITFPVEAVDIRDGAATPLTIEVRIIDTNDNEPVFKEPYYEFSITENRQGKLEVFVSATDDDLGRNGQLRYYTDMYQDTPFRVGYVDGEVELWETVDREQTAYLEFDVLAIDMSSRPNVGRVKVNITILDENDNYPIFTALRYYVALEIGSIPMYISNVTANDKDVSPQFSTLSYRIISGNRDVAFEINNSGEVNLVKSVNPGWYTLTIQASDGKFTGKCTLNIELFESNSIRFTQREFTFHVREDLLQGEVIGRVNITRIDEVSLEVVGTSYFTIKTNGDVVNGEYLDYEDTRTHQFLVVGTTVDLNDIQTQIVIVVEDVNDNPPKFNETSYNATIYENVDAGLQVITINASDDDSGANGEIHYEMDPFSSVVAFSVDSNSGEVIVVGEVDRETHEYFIVTVLAIDSGTPPLNSSTHIRINIRDVNDNEPTLQGMDMVYIAENTPINGIIYRASVRDNDATPEFSTLIFSLESDRFRRFSIDSNGSITLQTSVLGRVGNIMSVTIVASDGLHRSSMLLTIKVMIGFADQVYRFNITEGENAEKTQIGQVFLTSQPANVEYTTINTNIHIEINNDGELFTDYSFDREMKDFYSFSVTSKVDSSTYRAFTTVEIYVMDINDNTPRFRKSPYEASIPENVAYGYPVLKLTAVDKDIGNNADLSYSFENTSIPFGINITTGDIFVSGSIDMEAVTFYNLTALVSDGINSNKTSVSITILDENDNNPVFHGMPYTANISETLQKGELVYIVSASDADIHTTEYSTISFTLLNYTETFTMIGNEIRLKSFLDYNQQNNYTITVQASDGGGNTATEVVIINIIKSQESQLVFRETVYKFNVTENQTAGEFVGEVKLKSSMEDISFALTKYDDIFHVNARGELSTLKLLDREEFDTYELVTVATKDDQSASTKIVITVIDVNDNAPRFVYTTPNMFISEDVGSVVYIGSVVAIDDDIGLNGEVVYSIENNSPFNISRDGGVITIDGHTVSRDAIDYERTKVLYIEIKARDKGVPSLSSMVNVTIHVINVNDNDPVFVPDYYTVNITENSPIGTVLDLKLNVSDLDQQGLMYFLDKTNKSIPFSINEITGSVSVSDDIDRERFGGFISFVVRVTEIGVIGSTASAKVDVLILDINDNGPQFFAELYTATITNSAKVGDNITKVHAIDNDATELYSKLAYFIVSGNVGNFFAIDKHTGQITLAKSLPKARLTVLITMVIKAEDFGGLQITTTVEITVTEFSFMKSDYIFYVAKNTSGRNQIGTLLTNELDESVDFRIVPDFGIFKVESNADVYIVSTINHGLKRLKIEVIAMDKNSNTHITSADVMVKFYDKYLMSFEKEEYHVAIPENIGTNYYMITVKAVDVTLENITYRLLDDKNGTFKINSSNGKLYVLRNLDFGKNKTYNIIVEARSEPNIATKHMTLNDKNGISKPKSSNGKMYASSNLYVGNNETYNTTEARSKSNIATASVIIYSKWRSIPQKLKPPPVVASPVKQHFQDVSILPLQIFQLLNLLLRMPIL